MFTDQATTLVGLAFKADLTRIRNQLPNTTFANDVTNYCDLALFYSSLREFECKQKGVNPEEKISSNLRGIT